MDRRGSMGILLALIPLLHACHADSPVGSDLANSEADVAPQLAQDAPVLIPEQYIVVFHDDVPDPAEVAGQLARAHGLQVGHVYRSALKGFSARGSEPAVEALRRNPRVRYIEQNAIYQLEGRVVARAEARSAVSQWTGEPPTEGLRVHLVASDLAATLSDGDGVGVWPNRGSEGDAAQAKASRLPTFHAGGSGFNGKPHVGFNEGSDDDEVLEITGVADHGSGTLIAVYRQDETHRHNYGIFAPWGSSSNRASFITYRSSDSRVSYWDGTNGWLVSDAAAGAGQDRIVMWRVQGSQLADFSVDGTPVGSVTASSDMRTPFDRYVIGAVEPKSRNRFDGQIAELLFYDRALASCEADQVVADLGARYGIAVSVTGGPCGLPGDPSGLVASPVDHREIDLAWGDGSDNEDGFRVERRQGQQGTWQAIADVAANVTTYADVGLAGGTEYCYRVRSFNADGSSGYSNVDCATTAPPVSVPPPITVPTEGLRVRLIGNDLVGAVVDGSEVDVWANRGSAPDAAQAMASRLPTFHATGAAFSGQASVGFNEGSDDDEALEIAGVTSHASGTLIAVFSQEASNSHNYGIFAPWGSSSSRASFITSRSTDGLLTYWDPNNGWAAAQASVGVGSEHVVVWRMDGSRSVDFQVDGTAAGSGPVSGNLPAPFDRYVVGAVEPSTNSRFDGRIAELLFYDRVLAGCERDEIVANLGERYGITVSVTADPCSPPAAPTGLVATPIDDRQIDVGWTDGSNNEDGFRVERRQGQVGTWQPVADAGPDATTYSDVGLVGDTEYCYRVQAYNADGISGYSNVDCATTGPSDPLPPPVTVPTDGLRVRLVGNDLVGTLTDGSDVGFWPNRGSEVDATQGNAARLPTLRATGSAFNGHASVGFNEGSDDDEVLEIPGVVAHGSGTLIAVFSPEASNSHNYGIFAPWGSSSSRASFLTSRSSDGLVSYWDPVNGWAAAQTSVATGSEHIVVWWMSGSTSVDFQVDGTTAGSSVISGDFPSPFDRYVVGAVEPSTNSRFDGQIAELLFYDRAILGCEADQIVANLGDRYGIAVSVVADPCGLPGAPSELVSTPVDYRRIDVSWTDGAGNEDGFRVERREGQQGTWGLLATLDANTTTYVDAPLIPETEYCYRVLAFNSDGDSPFSNIHCTTTPAAPPGVCFDTGNHDSLADLWNISKIGADLSETWRATRAPGCGLVAWYFGLDSGVDSDHPDLHVVEVRSFVAAEPGHTGEDGNGHGTHTAATAAAIDGNGGVVGVAPGAAVYGFRVCTDDGQCTVADILAGIDEITARKQANPSQPMVANMSLAGSPSDVMDEAVRRSVNAGIVYAIGAGNGILGACLFPKDASEVSPARVGDDDIKRNGGSSGNTARVNGAITITSSTSSDGDANCNYGNPVTVAAPGVSVYSGYLNGGYATLSGTSMATPHAAGAAILYLQSFPDATPTQVEQAIVSALGPWSTSHPVTALGRLNVTGF